MADFILSICYTFLSTVVWTFQINHTSLGICMAYVPQFSVIERVKTPDVNDVILV